jgi:hypothetical protein
VTRPGDQSHGEELLVPARMPRRRRLTYLAAAVLAAAALGAGLVSRYGGGRHRAAPSPPISSPAPQPPAPSTAVNGPVVRTAALPDLGDVRLFVRAEGAVAELNFAAGWIRSIPLPPLQVTGPVTFGVTTGGAFVRPASGAPGYYVPDAGPARPLDGALADATVLPAPDPDHVWTVGYGSDWAASLHLVAVRTGARTGHVLRVPRRIGPLVQHPMPDGSGYLLATGAAGSYDVRPGGAHRLPVDLATSTLLASGSDRLLVASCAPSSPRMCPAQLLRLPDGHPLGPPGRLGRLTATAAQPAGVISPDGRSALVYQANASGLPQARLLDLGTGRFRGPAIAVDPDVQSGALAYAPDGRWAFAVSAGGRLTAIDVRTGSSLRIAIALPQLEQLAPAARRITSQYKTVPMQLQAHIHERIDACFSPPPMTPTRFSNANLSRC